MSTFLVGPSLFVCRPILAIVARASIMSSELHSSAAFAQSSADCLTALGVDGRSGLTAARVSAIRESDGWNELATSPGEPLWKRFAGQFADVVVWILLAAAFISGAMGEWTDTAAIAAIVLAM